VRKKEVVLVSIVEGDHRRRVGGLESKSGLVVAPPAAEGEKEEAENGGGGPPGDSDPETDPAAVFTRVARVEPARGKE